MLGAFGERRAQEGAGKYRYVLPLGQGGTADVYLAVADGPAGFQKLVVLKVLKQSLAADCDFRTMLLGEARLAARLQHPNIVQTYEVIDDDGGPPTIVMEFLDGQPLSNVIVRGRQQGFSLAMQVRVLCDALAGLHAAHEAVDFDGTPLGVVHRDVSPHNLFVTVEGQTKVLDFGIAKLQRSSPWVESVETDVGTVKGKLRYMAPEQIAGGKLDRRADIYAAGVVLWEALAGERMWKGSSEAEIRRRVQAGELPSAGELARAAGAEVPAALDRICRRALARSPDDRQATALGLAEELEAALPALGPPVSAREIGALVARLFEDARAETRRAIERTLSAAANAGAPPADAGAPAMMMNRAIDRTRETSGPIDDASAPAATPERHAGPDRPRPAGRRAAWALAGVAALVAVAIGAAATWRGAGGRAARARPAVDVPAATVPAAATYGPPTTAAAYEPAPAPPPPAVPAPPVSGRASAPPAPARGPPRGRLGRRRSGPRGAARGGEAPAPRRRRRRAGSRARGAGAAAAPPCRLPVPLLRRPRRNQAVPSGMHVIT
jgi:tRNA A-37 threonylcarbamoyl transferase component Bud32